MRSVVARGPLFIERQFGLYPVEHLLADEPRNVRNIRPCLGRGGVLALGWFAQRMCGGAPDTSRTCAGPSDIEFAGIGRIRQQSVEGGGTPASIPTRRLDPTLEQVLG